MKFFIQSVSKELFSQGMGVHEDLASLWRQFRSITSICFQPSFNQRQLEKLDDLCEKFVNQVQSTIGVTFCTIKMHMLLHMAQNIRTMGKH